jgi:hypothetical protein
MFSTMDLGRSNQAEIWSGFTAARSHRPPDNCLDRVHVLNCVAQSVGAENDVVLGFKQIEEFRVRDRVPLRSP